jgi:bifunctional DNA-binding transcriptional regulator/antitoxin component of YhaV-PrlF toxin-antitoxin module
MLEEGKGRFIDAGWRITIPKSMREALGWDKGHRCVRKLRRD